MIDPVGSEDAPPGAVVDRGRRHDDDDCVSALVDGLARLKADTSGQPLGICFEVLGGGDRPPVEFVDGGAEE